MPFYEYRCEDCGHELEALQKISDPPLVDCPDCGKAQLRKLVSAAAFRLKGGGWYETDFKKDGKKNLAGDAAEAGGKGDKKDAAVDGKAGGETKKDGGEVKKAGGEVKKAESKATSGNNKGSTHPA